MSQTKAALCGEGLGAMRNLHCLNDVSFDGTPSTSGFLPRSETRITLKSCLLLKMMDPYKPRPYRKQIHPRCIE